MRSNTLGAGELVDDNLITSFPNINTVFWQNAIYWFIFWYSTGQKPEQRQKGGQNMYV